jgi:uncharacterized membrane protein YeiB
MNPTAYGDHHRDQRVDLVFSHLLGSIKFWTIFSMLFGAGNRDAK